MKPQNGTKKNLFEFGMTKCKLLFVAFVPFVPFVPFCG